MLATFFRKHMLILGMLLLSFTAQSQSTDKFGMVPPIIPPSPEVAELARIGQLGSQLFTGASNVDIPIYTMSIGSAKMPISLTYSNYGRNKFY